MIERALIVTTNPAVARALKAIQAALADTSPVDLSWIQPPPTADGWTLAADALRFLHRIVVHLHPSHVLELGSGLSTRVLARACGQEKIACAISSLDHDPEFGRPAAGDAADFPSNVKVNFQLAPVVARDFGGKLLPAYLLDSSKLATKDTVDLVLIDGPPITLGGREGTLYQAMQFARPGTIALLDDAKRKSERRAVSHWRDALGDAIDVINLPGFSRGMTAVVVRKTISRDDLWQQKIRMAGKDLQRLVDAGESYMLIDQSCGDQPAADRRAVPFVEKDGEFYGAPADDADAIAELERQRANGIHKLAMLWPAFWWLTHYKKFEQHLRAQSRLITANDLVIVFELKR